MSLEISPSTSFTASAFSKKVRPAEETLNDGRVIKLPRYCTIPEYIKLVYKTPIVEPFKANFSFLDRDNKERRYQPEIEDPMVFKGGSSIAEFHKSALKLISFLTEYWESLGLPSKVDKDRGIKIPDTALVAESILHPTDSNLKIRELYHKHRSDVTMIGSNVDILKKACLVRTVLPGWYAVSYNGKNTKNVDKFSPALNVILKAFKHIRETSKFKSVHQSVIDEQGDPLDTNVGYPFYAATIDAQGNPIAKLMVLNSFKGVGTKNFNFPDVVKSLTARVQDPILARYPFAVACIRRLQPGYKWSHVWKPTPYGLTLDRDERGNATNRVAFMAPYLLNLYLSPIQSEWKAIRKLIPGCFFDGDSKKEVLRSIRRNKSLLMESDYSNYDRNIPNNLIARLFGGWASFTGHPNYYFDLLKQTHANLALIWPDWTPGTKGRGWIFKTESLGLLSGLKITSEVGTFCNLIIIGQALLDSQVFTQEQLFTYLTAKADGRTVDPCFLIQSDDTMFIHKNEETLVKMVNAFVKCAEDAGIPGALEIGDRFLMRHMTGGADKPLSSRIYQNTLSNEESYDDPLKFVVGLCARTDGMLGQKSIDPFETGKNQGVTPLELEFDRLVLTELHHFLSTAKIPNGEAVNFISMMINASKRMIKRGSKYYMKEEDIHSIDNARNRFIRALAHRELAIASSGKKFMMESLIASLNKQALSPTSKYILDEIIAMSQDAESVLKKIAQKENQFYRFAMKQLNLNLEVN